MDFQNEMMQRLIDAAEGGDPVVCSMDDGSVTVVAVFQGTYVASDCEDLATDLEKVAAMVRAAAAGQRTLDIEGVTSISRPAEN